MMKGKHSHNKFMRFVTLPIRALGKARDFYVRSMIKCADGTNYGGNLGGTLPKSFSARSTRSSNGSGDDYSELIRAASVRSMGHLNEIDMLLKQHMQMRSQQQSAAIKMGSNGKGFPKSCSVGMAGFMGRIEEEKPGDLSEEGSVHAKTKDSVYPRSKSVAVSF